jgi:hypothetical protein
LERRLVPINAFIGLCDPSPPWPSTLADAGFRLAALEVPVVTEAGTVTLDGVAHSRATDELLVVECKSGANIEEDQARRLATVQAASVVRSAAISLGTPAAPQVEVIYLCLEEDTERIVLGLEKVQWQRAVLALSTTHLRMVRGPLTLPSLRDRFRDPIPLRGPPPGFITVDPESPMMRRPSCPPCACRMSGKPPARHQHHFPDRASRPPSGNVRKGRKRFSPAEGVTGGE